MIINSLTVEYLPQIIRINRLTKASNWTEKQFLEEINCQASIGIGLIDKPAGRLKGFLFARLITISNSGSLISNETEEFKASETIIDLLLIAVDPQYAGNGIGTKLFRILIQHHAPPVVIYLETRKSNTAAVSFYQKNNFKFLYERKNYYTNPIDDALIMEYSQKTQNSET